MVNWQTGQVTLRTQHAAVRGQFSEHQLSALQAGEPEARRAGTRVEQGTLRPRRHTLNLHAPGTDIKGL